MPIKHCVCMYIHILGIDGQNLKIAIEATKEAQKILIGGTN